MKYRIIWKRKGEEKACGWGEPIFDDREAARQFAEDANKRYPSLFHWIGEFYHEITTGGAVESEGKTGQTQQSQSLPGGELNGE